MTIIRDAIETGEVEPSGSYLNENGEEILENKERGCGFLDHGKGYLRQDGSPGGSMPRFVEIPEENRIPFKEDHFRHYKQFPGTNFELSLIEEAADLDWESSSPMEYVSALSNNEILDPPGEIWNHIKRLAGSAAYDGDHYGEMDVARAHDILMWVGETYYPTPREFIDEVRVQGLNKAIPISSRNTPPRINPGLTRLWLIHPKGIDRFPEASDEDLEDRGIDPEERYSSAIIGYVYLTRVVYTEPADGEVPEYVQNWEAAGHLDRVKVGEPVHAAEEEHDTEALKAAADGGSEDDQE